MKASHQCPKCDSLDIGYFERVFERCEAPSSSGQPFAPTAVGFMRTPAAERQVAVGRFEAFVCGGCGYYETYVKDAKNTKLEFLEGFRWLNRRDRESSPYR